MLKYIYVLNVELELLSGMYIGGSDEGFDIGGADSRVIKNPLTKEPYIPGSSLKGKLKSLLKYRYGTIGLKDITFTDNSITKIFEPLETNDEEIKITRAIFRDFTLTKGSSEKLQNILGKNIFTEIKAENSINPIQGKAANPRFIERVPAGAIFEGEIVLNVFEGDNEEEMKNHIKDALKLLQFNYIGGSGSRGYGKVKVKYDDFKKEEL